VDGALDRTINVLSPIGAMGGQSGSIVPNLSEVKAIASTDYSWVDFGVDNRSRQNWKKRVRVGLIGFDIHRRIGFGGSGVAGVKWSKRQSR